MLIIVDQVPIHNAHLCLRVVDAGWAVELEFGVSQLEPLVHVRNVVVGHVTVDCELSVDLSTRARALHVIDFGDAVDLVAKLLASATTKVRSANGDDENALIDVDHVVAVSLAG